MFPCFGSLAPPPFFFPALPPPAAPLLGAAAADTAGDFLAVVGLHKSIQVSGMQISKVFKDEKL